MLVCKRTTFNENVSNAISEADIDFCITDLSTAMKDLIVSADCNFTNTCNDNTYNSMSQTKWFTEECYESIFYRK